MADENHEREPEQGEGSDKEQNLANLRKAKEAAEHRAQEREQELQEIRAEQRRNSIQSILASNGLPANLARVYPEDAEVSEDAVVEFASELGVAPEGRNPGPTPEERQHDRYERFVTEGSFAPTSDVDELLDKQLRGLEKLVNRKTVPSPEEIEEQEQLTREANALNQRMEKEARMGRFPKPETGIRAFGGLMDPPIWADRTAQARQEA